MKTFYLILIASLLSSCATVKKNGYWQTRRYNYGKHIVKEVKGKKKKVQPTVNLVLPDEFILESKDEIMLSITSKTKTPEILTKVPLMLNLRETEQQDFQRTSDSCDLIILRDSSTISCRITDMTLEGYKYTNCYGNEEQFIGREKIKEIQFADGRLVQIQETVLKAEPEEKNVMKTIRIIVGFGVVVFLIVLYESLRSFTIGN